MLAHLLRKHSPAFFAGAGISRAEPAGAPLWKEMQTASIAAMYARMKGEPWVEGPEFFEDEAVLRNFDFRPESFWEIVLRETSLAVIVAAFQVLSSGRPNLNHRVLARLLSEGRITGIVTPNFDEYFEAAAGSSARIVKIHGTLASPESLQFTLTHTRKLPDERVRVLEDMLSRGVVIAGYSGNDDDLMPHLRRLAERVDPMIVMMHPAASAGEPVRTLRGPGVRFVEADINEELREVATEYGLSPEPGADEPKHHDAIYSAALAQLPVVTTVLAVAGLHQFTANDEGLLKYAHLAEDICLDKRYAAESERWAERVQRFVRAGYASMSRPEMVRAADAGRTPLGVLHRDLETCFGILKRGNPSPDEHKFLEFILTGAPLYADQYGDGELRFLSNWYLGRYRRTQQRFAEAFAAFEAAANSLDAARSSHFDFIGFSLDYGNAYADYAIFADNVEALEEATRMFRTTAAMAKQIGDHHRAAQGLMNLAKCYAVGGMPQEVPRFLADAEAEARLSGNAALRERLEEWKRTLLDPDG